jgi:glycosyltransferase involved in cell wall biosynthesis
MGGFERTCAEFARQAALRNSRATFVFEGEPCEALATALTAHGAAYHVIDDVGVMNFDHSLRLAKLVRQLQPDFIHLHFCEFYRSFFAMAALLRVPLAATYHYSGEPVPSRGLRRWLKHLRRIGLGWPLKRITAVSNAAREKFAGDYLVDAERVSLTYNGTDLLGFRERAPGFAKGMELPAELQSASPKLLYVGALAAAKGVHIAIRALALAQTQLPMVTLTIVGDGPDRATLEALAAELGVAQRVVFLGMRSDVPQLLAAHDTMLVPSIWKEAFGYVLIEAMAVGCPVIASDVGGIPEVITNDQEGLLVRPSDVVQLSDAIVSLARNPGVRGRLVHGAMEKVRRVFALDESISRFWQLYR